MCVGTGRVFNTNFTLLLVLFSFTLRTCQEFNTELLHTVPEAVLFKGSLKTHWIIKGHLHSRTVLHGTLSYREHSDAGFSLVPIRAQPEDSKFSIQVSRGLISRMSCCKKKLFGMDGILSKNC